MNQNIKIAKQLIKLAEELTTNSEKNEIKNKYIPILNQIIKKLNSKFFTFSYNEPIQDALFEVKSNLIIKGSNQISQFFIKKIFFTIFLNKLDKKLIIKINIKNTRNQPIASKEFNNIESCCNWINSEFKKIDKKVSIYCR